MTTKVNILNSGPKSIAITGGTSGTPATVAPGDTSGDIYFYEAAPLTIQEIADEDPGLGGGHGEDH